MVAKRFRGKPCAYCVENLTETEDHVVCRQLFQIEERDNLPKVGACARCNNEKSALELYLTAVLPLAGRHPLMIENARDGARRVMSNGKIHRRLQEGVGRKLTVEDGETIEATTFPIEGAKVSELIRYITKGLHMLHWEEPMPTTHDVMVMHIQWDQPLPLNAYLSRPMVSKTLGMDSFKYVGSRTADKPYASAWKMQLYGGARLVRPSGTEVDAFAVLAGPRTEGLKST